MNKLLCPSMMCADYGNLENEIKALEESGIDIFHVDLMDGHYVPNFGMGLQDIEYICKHANKPVDIHLMISEPSKYIDKFADIGCSIIYVHPEVDHHVARTLDMIKARNVKAGIAINPGTSYETIKDLLSLVDYILVMSVNPGFAGQKYLSFVDKKIEKLCEVKKDYHYKIMLDGACSSEVIERLSKIGVDGFILGTSALFNKGRPYKELMDELRKI